MFDVFCLQYLYYLRTLSQFISFFIRSRLRKYTDDSKIHGLLLTKFKPDRCSNFSKNRTRQALRLSKETAHLDNKSRLQLFCPDKAKRKLILKIKPVLPTISELPEVTSSEVPVLDDNGQGHVDETISLEGPGIDYQLPTPSQPPNTPATSIEELFDIDEFLNSQGIYDSNLFPTSLERLNSPQGQGKPIPTNIGNRPDVKWYRIDDFANICSVLEKK